MKYSDKLSSNELGKCRGIAILLVILLAVSVVVFNRPTYIKENNVVIVDKKTNNTNYIYIKKHDGTVIGFRVSNPVYDAYLKDSHCNIVYSMDYEEGNYDVKVPILKSIAIVP